MKILRYYFVIKIFDVILLAWLFYLWSVAFKILEYLELVVVHAVSSFLYVLKVEVMCHRTELYFSYNFTGEHWCSQSRK